MNPYYHNDLITIYNGDCFEVLDNICSADLIVTDPPYGMGKFETDGKDYLDAVAPALRKAFSKLNNTCSMFVFASTGQVVQVANALGMVPKRLLWMYKPAANTYPLGGWLLTSEAILWFHKGGKLNLRERKPYRHDCYIHRRSGLEGVEGHPTVKPISVVTDLVSRCPEGGVVLDPYLGSGTTLRACKDLGVRGIGIELEEKYCEIAANRMSQEVLAL